MFLTILFLLVAIYCGAALGFLMMTYNIPSLKLARRIYIHVPYLTVKITIKSIGFKPFKYILTGTFETSITKSVKAANST